MIVVDVAGLAVGGVEEFRLQGGDPLQIEPAAAEDGVQGDVGALGVMDLGQGVEAAQPGLDAGQFGGGDKIGLVEDDLVGEGDLLARLAAVGQARQDVLGVDHRGH